MSDDRLLVGGKLVLPDRVLEGGALLLSGGKIEAIIEADGELPSLPRHDLGGAWVTPGLVELHIHGAGGIGFDELEAGPASGRGPDVAKAAASLRRIAAFLRSRGVTTFVPTLVSRERELALLAAAIEEAALPRSTLPGIYLEGPFINPARRGGIPADAIMAYDRAALDRILSLARDKVLLMTFAPELPHSGELAAALAARHILPCLGHSDASIERDPLPAEPFSITHLFNAMSPFSHKEAGLAMLPFVDGRPFVELNADGVHVGAPALRAAARALDPSRLILISDAVVAAGLPHGEYSYYGKKIVSGPDGVRHADTKVLMGSNRLAPEVLRNWLAVTGAPIPSALRALTLNPARALGLARSKGAIAPCLDADLVVWDGNFEGVREVIG